MNFLEGLEGLKPIQIRERLLLLKQAIAAKKAEIADLQTQREALKQAVAKAGMKTAGPQADEPGGRMDHLLM